MSMICARSSPIEFDLALLLRCTALTCYSSIILGFGVSAMRRREFITLIGRRRGGVGRSLRA
jgi:hypothetical protein